MQPARRHFSVGLSLSVVLTAFACDPAAIDASSDDSLEPSFRTIGGIWIGNGLEDPDVSGVDPSHGLATTQGLDPNGTLMSTEAGIEIAGYIAQCALPAGQSLTKLRESDGRTIVLAGALGLAAEWKDGACNATCQEWVTACLLARTNVTGVTIGLWLSADHPAIGLGKDPGYPLYEATFYGNVFQDPEAQYLCRGTNAGTGGLGDHLLGRTCGGLPPEACGFTQWGSCHDVGRCITVNGPHHIDCAAGTNPAAGARYHSISTYVQSNGWQ